MNIIEVIVLGLVQGLTEFIPVSSSGHLDIIPKLLGFPAPSTAFITFLHFGTLISLLFYFRERLIKYLKSFVKLIRHESLDENDKGNTKTIFNLIIATIPAAIIGVILENIISDFYDSEANSKTSAVLILSAMIIIGVLFLFANRFFKNRNSNLLSLNSKKSFIIGISQTFAFFRGVSRSGITLIMGQAVGLDRVSAAEFGFLMSIPIMTATSLYSVYQLIKLPPVELQNELMPSIVGFLVAAFAGYIAIRFLLNFLKNHGLTLFGVYRIIFGITALLIILSR